MRRILAVVFFFAALLRFWFDWQASRESGEGFELALVGDVWFEFNLNSLQLTQVFIERYVEAYTGQWLWDPIVLTILGWPMAFVLLGLSAFFWIIRRRKSRKIFFRD